MTRARYLWAALLAAGFAAATAADDATLKVKVGDKFPNVALEAVNADTAKADATELSIADLKGKVVVVFFYPRANTPGCTIESCGFRDLQKEFPEDVVLVGASNDPRPAQQKFAQDHSLPYPLLCDPEMKLIKALGIASAKGNAAQRISFLVDRDGVIRKIYTSVTPAKHPKEVLTDARELVKQK